MNIKRFHPIPLLLIPSVFITSEFLSQFFIIYASVFLLLISVSTIPYKVSLVNIPLIYFIFQEYNFKIVPETTIPALALLILSQFSYNRSINRNESFLYFLWLGIFSVFSSSLYYLLYAMLTLISFTFIQHYSKDSNAKNTFSQFKNNGLQVLLILITTLSLFIFFPRFYNFFPSANTQSLGKIGYSKEINNSTISKLRLSSLTAFYAETKTQIPTSQLYWRGRVHTYTDGYNWKSKNIQPLRGKVFSEKYSSAITINMKYEQDLAGDLIILDKPYRVSSSNLRRYQVRATNEYRFYQKNKKALYTTQSILKYHPNEKVVINPKLIKTYTQLPEFIPKQIQSIANNIKSSKAEKIILAIKKFLIKEGFSYTLEPGSLPTMASFIDKKQGYCSHYASFLAIILRYKGIPARLISGFQGGEYNELGQYYTVSSNDAHAWVEYYNGQSWMRVDPTEFISPDRIFFGGSQFLLVGNEVQTRNQNSFINNLKKFKLFLDNLNYQVSLILDNFDRNSQRNLAKKLNLDYKYFFIFGFLATSIIALAMYFLGQRKKYNAYEVYLKKLDKKYKPNGQKFIQIKTMAQAKTIAHELALEDQEEKALLDKLEKYQNARYSKNGKLKDLVI